MRGDVMERRFKQSHSREERLLEAERLRKEARSLPPGRPVRNYSTEPVKPESAHT
jgi:hypothetical protein